jgi:hypothetical protein
MLAAEQNGKSGSSLWQVDHAEVQSLQRLLDEGHVPIPTRWIDTDRNAHQRRDGGRLVTADYKSRLGGRGDLEGINGQRKDSPIAEIESHNLLFSGAASCKLILKTADISDAPNTRTVKQ